MRNLGALWHAKLNFETHSLFYVEFLGFYENTSGNFSFFLDFFPWFSKPSDKKLTSFLKKKGFLLEYLCASILSEEINDNFFFIIQKKKITRSGCQSFST